MIKNIRYFIEFVIVKSFLFLTRVIPLSIMSTYSAMLFLVIGSKLEADKTADRGLKFVFPNKSEDDISEIKETVWKNLGYNFAEFYYLSNLNKNELSKHVKITGLENVTKLTEKGIPILFFGGHFANWELIPIFFKTHKIKTNLIYRKINNHFLDEFVLNMRSSDYTIMHEKGLKNASKIVSSIKRGECFASLVDQKLTEGIKIDFFGKKTRTPSLIAQLAIKFELPIIGLYVKRLGKLSYELRFEDVLQYKKFENKKSQIREIMSKINTQIENWVIEDPGGWFWVHNRWNKPK